MDEIYWKITFISVKHCEEIYVVKGAFGVLEISSYLEFLEFYSC